MSLIISLPSWIEVAEKEIGVKETPGSASTSRILEYAQATTLKATSDEVPWCSAFVNWVFSQVNITGTKSAMARSWLSWGTRLSLRFPPFGCIVILARGSSGLQGHVGFFAGVTSDGLIRVLGGNQHDSVCFENLPTEKVLGYRWPQ